jgi:hypothetical protein
MRLCNSRRNPPDVLTSITENDHRHSTLGSSPDRNESLLRRSDSSSVIVIASSSSNTGSVSEKRTSCFLKLASAFPTSHSSAMLLSLYARDVHTSIFNSKLLPVMIEGQFPALDPCSLFPVPLTFRPPKARSSLAACRPADGYIRPAARGGESCGSAPCRERPRGAASPHISARRR